MITWDPPLGSLWMIMGLVEVIMGLGPVDTLHWGYRGGLGAQWRPVSTGGSVDTLHWDYTVLLPIMECWGRNCVSSRDPSIEAPGVFRQIALKTRVEYPPFGARLDKHNQAYPRPIDTLHSVLLLMLWRGHKEPPLVELCVELCRGHALAKTLFFSRLLFFLEPNILGDSTGYPPLRIKSYKQIFYRGSWRIVI